MRSIIWIDGQEKVPDLTPQGGTFTVNHTVRQIIKLIKLQK